MSYSGSSALKHRKRLLPIFIVLLLVLLSSMVMAACAEVPGIKGGNNNGTNNGNNNNNCNGVNNCNSNYANPGYGNGSPSSGGKQNTSSSQTTSGSGTSCPATPDEAANLFGGNPAHWARIASTPNGWHYGPTADAVSNLHIPQGYLAQWWDNSHSHQQQGPADVGYASEASEWC